MAPRKTVEKDLQPEDPVPLNKQPSILVPDHDKIRSRRTVGGQLAQSDIKQLEKNYTEKGYYQISEISLIMCNDLYDNVSLIQQTLGITNEEYHKQVKLLQDAIGKQAPYFSKPNQPSISSDEEQDTDAIIGNVMKFLDDVHNKKK